MTFADVIADVTTRYLLEAGGKRVRPTLTLLTAQLGTGNNPSVITAAEAVEITHLASLYHDDVMDEAQMRRGVPSAQAVWGNSVAILTGDLLFARASKLIAQPRRARAHASRPTPSSGSCSGSCTRPSGRATGEDPIEHYLQVLADKTGSLIAAAAQVGVIFGEAPEEYREPVELVRRAHRRRLPADRRRASTSPPRSSRPARPPGTDLRAGVPTLPLLYLRRPPAPMPKPPTCSPASSATSTGIGDPAADADFAAAVAELRGHDVTRDTLAEAQRWADRAVEALAPAPRRPRQEGADEFAEAIVERTN